MIKKKLTYISIIAFVVSFNSYLVYAKDTNNVTIESENGIEKNIVPDSVITAEIVTQYLNDIDIKLLNIRVETVNGIVTLTGKVPNVTIKEKIIDIARDTVGVKEVIAIIDIV